MEMSKNELARRYRAAGSSMQERKRQITILAELNGCTAADIRKALLEAGIKEEDLPNKPGPKKRGQGAKAAEPAEKTQAAEDKTEKQTAPAGEPGLSAAITDKIEGLIEVQNQARREIERMEEIFADVTEAIKLLRGTLSISSGSDNT